MAIEENQPSMKQEGKQPSYGVILLISILLVVVLSGFFYIAFGHQSSFLPLSDSQTPADHSLPLTGKDGLYFVELPKLKINLQKNDQNFAFIETTLALELSKPSDKKEIEAVLPRILDSLHVYLREIDAEELQETGGLYRMKEALLERINFLIAPAHVNDVLFKEMFVGQKM